MAPPSNPLTHLGSLGNGRALSRAAVDLARGIAGAMFPSRCVGCSQEGELLCGACLRKAQRLDLPYRPSSAAGPNACLVPSTTLQGVLACFAMEGAVREAVHDLKYHGVRLVAPVMGKHMAERVRASGSTFDEVMAVPLHPKRLRERGYNQAHLLAVEVARDLGLPLRAGALRRVRHSPPLARAQSLDDRRNAVRRAFEFVERADGLRLLVVDDVCTTGATLDACAQPLMAAGALSVWGLTFAREV